MEFMPTLPVTAMRRYGQRSASATPRLSCFVPAMSTSPSSHAKHSIEWKDDTPRLTRFAALHSIEAAREATPRLTQFMPVVRPAFSPRSDASSKDYDLSKFVPDSWSPQRAPAPGNSSWPRGPIQKVAVCRGSEPQHVQ